MKVIVLCVVLAACIGVRADDGPFAFKGIALGSDLTEVDSHRFFCDESDSYLAADQICVLGPKRETIAEAPVELITLSYYGRKLHSIVIEFDAKYFEQVTAAMKEKYGDGVLTTENLQNRMGAKFQNRVLRWRRTGEELRVRQFAVDLDHSTATFRNDFALEEFNRRRQSSTKAGANDL